MLNKKGFTILELLMSIAIFSIAIVSILSVVNINLRADKNYNNSYMANNFAIEGIEILTYLRDNNFLNKDNYLNDISNYDRTAILVFDNITNTWQLDFGNDNNSENINICSTNTNNSCEILKSQNFGFYTQKRLNTNLDLKPTGFYRLITINTLSGRLKIQSTVMWTEKGFKKYINLEKDLWDWN
jgi:prepilin-type N-terminal cleavage/methylation domain-containing protein